MKFCPNVSVPSRGYLFLNHSKTDFNSLTAAVSVPSRGYLFLNRMNIWKMLLTLVSVPSRGYLFLNAQREELYNQPKLFPSPLGGISSSTVIEEFTEQLT